MANFDDALAFEKWVDAKFKSLKFPEDAEVKDPVFETPGLNFWTYERIVKFPDKHIRVWEHYSKKKGLQLSSRNGFSFHYGTLAADPEDYESDDPVDIRIDNSGSPAHLHLDAPLPHIPQAKLEGIVLESVEMFTFINAVLKHRKTGKPFPEVLGFRLI